MPTYKYKNTRLMQNETVELPEGAKAVNIYHVRPPNRSPVESFIEWLEPESESEDD